jgi:hypothetical protein
VAVDGEGPGLIVIGAGAGPGAIITIGAGAPGAIFIMGAAGPGLIVIGAAAIMTGLAYEAEQASITLGLGLGASRPTPIKARFESSIVKGAGSIIRTYVETFGLGMMNVSMVQAIKSPRSTLNMDSIYLCHRIFP